MADLNLDELCDLLSDDEDFEVKDQVLKRSICNLIKQVNKFVMLLRYLKMANRRTGGAQQMWKKWKTN